MTAAVYALLALAIAGADSCAPAQQSAVSDTSQQSTCRVARVVDGDTFRCSDGTRVRLLLIDAPERSQGEYFQRSRAALRAMLPAGSRVRLDYDVQRKDQFGRDLAYVYTSDKKLVNEEMLRAGYAVVLVYPPNVRHVERMRAAAAEARENRRGLWSTPAFDCLPLQRRQRRC